MHDFIGEYPVIVEWRDSNGKNTEDNRVEYEWFSILDLFCGHSSILVVQKFKLKKFQKGAVRIHPVLKDGVPQSIFLPTILIKNYCPKFARICKCSSMQPRIRQLLKCKQKL